MSTTPDQGQPATMGEALVAELRWVHDHIRHDLDVVQGLANRVLDGAEPDEVTEEIGRLKTNGPLWKLRVNCLYYCRFVHAHHNLEDIALFPALREKDPALTPVVDKLEADHRLVSDYLDEIEDAVREIGREDSTAARLRIVDALEGLREHLLEHLEFEETEIAPTLSQFTHWPGIPQG